MPAQISFCFFFVCFLIVHAYIVIQVSDCTINCSISCSYSILVTLLHLHCLLCLCGSPICTLDGNAVVSFYPDMSESPNSVWQTCFLFICSFFPCYILNHVLDMPSVEQCFINGCFICSCGLSLFREGSIRQAITEKVAQMR